MSLLGDGVGGSNKRLHLSIGLPCTSGPSEVKDLGLKASYREFNLEMCFSPWLDLILKSALS